MPILKTEKEIEIMAEGGRRLAVILDFLARNVRAGMKTKEIDAIAYKMIKEAGCEPAFLNYKPHGAKKAYPATACVSVNDKIVHGIPSAYVIKEGDLVKIDLGLKHGGFYLDAAVTVLASSSRERSGGAGEIDDTKKKLIEVTKKAFELGIKEARPGNKLGDIGAAIQEIVEANGFSVADILTGHGIGRELHEPPHVYNSGRRGKGEKLEEGMVIAIEPMVTAGPPPGGGKLKQLADDSFNTADGSLSAHFEHTVAITKNGPKVLTKI